MEVYKDDFKDLKSGFLENFSPEKIDCKKSAERFASMIRVYNDTDNDENHLGGICAKALIDIEPNEIFCFEPEFITETLPNEGSALDNMVLARGQNLAIPSPIPLAAMIPDYAAAKAEMKAEQPSLQEISDSMTSLDLAQLHKHKTDDAHDLTFSDLDLAMTFENVKSLNLSAAKLIKLNTFPVKAMFPELEHVDASSNADLEVEDVIDFINQNELVAFDCFMTPCENSIKEIAHQCPTLKRIGTYFIEDDFNYFNIFSSKFLKIYEISEKFLEIFIEKFKNIEILDFSSMDSFTEKHLKIVNKYSLLLSDSFLSSVNQQELLKCSLVNDTKPTNNVISWYPAVFSYESKSCIVNAICSAFHHSSSPCFRYSITASNKVLMWSVKRIRKNQILTRDFANSINSDLVKKHIVALIYGERRQISPIPPIHGGSELHIAPEKEGAVISDIYQRKSDSIKISTNNEYIKTHSNYQIVSPEEADILIYNDPIPTDNEILHKKFPSTISDYNDFFFNNDEMMQTMNPDLICNITAIEKLWDEEKWLLIQPITTNKDPSIEPVSRQAAAIAMINNNVFLVPYSPNYSFGISSVSIFDYERRLSFNYGNLMSHPHGHSIENYQFEQIADTITQTFTNFYFSTIRHDQSITVQHVKPLVSIMYTIIDGIAKPVQFTNLPLFEYYNTPQETLDFIINLMAQRAP